MKAFSKVLCLCLAVITMAVSFVSCSGNSENGNCYRLGGSGPLTGEYASYGTSVEKGAKLAIKKINEAGGLNGVKFSLDMREDLGDPEKAQNAFNGLFSSGVQATIGAVTSGACVAFAEAASSSKVFVLTPSASDAKVIAVGENVFRVCFGDPDQGVIAANELVKSYKKIGCLYDTSIDYSSGIFQVFKDQMTSLGKVEDTDFFAIGYPEKTTDFSTYIDQFKTLGCDVIFLPIYYEAAGLVAKAAATANFNIPIFGCDGLDGIDSQIDKSVTAKITYISPFDVKSTDEKVSSFVNDFKAEYNDSPDQFAADGYDAVMIIFEAMKKAGVNNVNISAAELCEILKKTITSADFSFTGVTGSNMTWSKDGACTKAPIIVEVKK